MFVSRRYPRDERHCVPSDDDWPRTDSYKIVDETEAEAAAAAAVAEARRGPMGGAGSHTEPPAVAAEASWGGARRAAFARASASAHDRGGYCFGERAAAECACGKRRRARSP